MMLLFALHRGGFSGLECTESTAYLTLVNPSRMSV